MGSGIRVTLPTSMPMIRKSGEGQKRSRLQNGGALEVVYGTNCVDANFNFGGAVAGRLFYLPDGGCLVNDCENAFGAMGDCADSFGLLGDWWE